MGRKAQTCIVVKQSKFILAVVHRIMVIIPCQDQVEWIKRIQGGVETEQSAIVDFMRVGRCVMGIGVGNVREKVGILLT